MSDATEFVDGLIVKAPNPKAPDFVKAAISIKVAELKDWLDKQQGEWVNLDVKVSKSGKWYAAVNTYQKQAKPQGVPETRKEIADSDIPF